MKFIYKLLALFLICLLPINILASTDNVIDSLHASVPENSTPVESVNVTIEDTTYESVFVGPDANYVQYHPSIAELNEFVSNSRAQGNYSFEQELMQYDDRIPFDTYVVHMNDGSSYTIVTVYNNVPTKKGYGNSQFYADRHYVSIVTPTPMAICKSLHINAINSNWYLKTSVIKDYKIVNSHYGREIIEDDYTDLPEIVPEPEQHIQPIEIDHPITTVPSNDNDNIDVDNSTVVENTTVNTNNEVNITENIENITGNQTNVTTEIGDNSSYNTVVIGNGNIIKNIYVVISDKFSGFIGSFNINV